MGDINILSPTFTTVTFPSSLSGIHGSVFINASSTLTTINLGNLMHISEYLILKNLVSLTSITKNYLTISTLTLDNVPLLQEMNTTITINDGVRIRNTGLRSLELQTHWEYGMNSISIGMYTYKSS